VLAASDAAGGGCPAADVGRKVTDASANAIKVFMNAQGIDT
jgi:hypothetical protein